MKIAIMQPYFFPYIGYFQLINAVDSFILGDDVQYIDRGWINRNRILKYGQDGFTYMGVPIVKHNYQTHIKDILAIEGKEWKTKILGQVSHYKKSPFFKAVYELLKYCFEYSERSITKLNGYYLKTVCDYIGIDFKMQMQSEMDFDYSNVTTTGNRPIRLCEQLGATEYINPIGGKELYSKAEFGESNITLRFMQANITEYDQQRGSFEPGLSILDVMMFNSPNDIKLMLKNYDLL